MIFLHILAPVPPNYFKMITFSKSGTLETSYFLHHRMTWPSTEDRHKKPAAAQSPAAYFVGW